MHITDPVGWWLVNVTHLLLTDSTLTQTPPSLPTSWPSRLSASRRSSWPTMRWTRLVVVYWCYSHLDIECLEWTNCAELHAQVPAQDLLGEERRREERPSHWRGEWEIQNFRLSWNNLHSRDGLSKPTGEKKYFLQLSHSFDIFGIIVSHFQSMQSQ